MDEQIEINVVSNVDETSEGFETLSDQLAKASDSALIAAKNIGALGKNEQTTAEQAKALATSQQNAMVAVKGLTPVVGNLNGALGAFGTVARSAGGAGEGFANGLQKVQMGMALTQSLGALTSGLAGAKAAMAAFNAVLLANPIMLIVAAVAALVAAVMWLVDWLNTDEEAVQGLIDAHNKYNETLNATTREQDLEIRKMQVLGKSEEEIIKKKQEHLRVLALNAAAEATAILNRIRMAKALGAEDEQLEELNKQYEEVTKSIKAYNDAYNKLSDDLEVNALRQQVNADKEANATKEANKEAAKRAQSEKEASAKRIEGIKNELKSLEEKREFEAKTKEEQAKALEESIKQQEEYLKAQKDNLKTESDWKKYIETYKNLQKEVKQLATIQGEIQAQNDKEKEEAKNAEEAKRNFDTQSQLLKEQSDYELALERATEEEKYQMQLEYYNKELGLLEQQMTDENLSYEERLKAANKYYDTQSKMQKLKSDNDKKQNQTQLDNQNKTNAAYLASADNMFSAVETLAGDNAKVMKAVNVGKAIQSTYVAANEALAAAPPPANFVMMGTTIAAGLANVVSILSESTTPAATPTAPVAETPVVETHQNLTLSEYEDSQRAAEAIKDQRVYLVESDVKGAYDKQVKLTETYRI